MNDLERGRACFLDRAIYGTTLRALLRLLRLIGNLAHDSSLSQGIVLGPFEACGKPSTVLLRQEDARAILAMLLIVREFDSMTYLANALEDGYGLLEVAHVKAGKNQLDVSEMAIAVLQLFTTTLAFRALV